MNIIKQHPLITLILIVILAGGAVAVTKPNNDPARYAGIWVDSWGSKLRIEVGPPITIIASRMIFSGKMKWSKLHFGDNKVIEYKNGVLHFANEEYTKFIP